MTVLTASVLALSAWRRLRQSGSYRARVCEAVVAEPALSGEGRATAPRTGKSAEEQSSVCAPRFLVCREQPAAILRGSKSVQLRLVYAIAMLA